jgi:Putative DNA-binding domain
MTDAEFAAAVLDPEMAVPIGLVDAKGRPAGKRFDVYRNNVASSLTRVLESGFPVVRKLVGDTFFAAMAAEFLRLHPPKSRMMMLYGSQFPDFLTSFQPVAHLGYLPDVARLELALRQSYHAADSQGIAAERLAAITPDSYSRIKLALSPSLFVLQSLWPVLSIWRANTDAAAPAPEMRAEDIVVLRPGYDPLPNLLPIDGASFVLDLQAGETLAEAIERCSVAPADLNALIKLLLDGQAIIDIEDITE